MITVAVPFTSSQKHESVFKSPKLNSKKPFINDGTEPLVVSVAKGGCECMTLKKLSLKGGEKGTFTFQFNREKPGKIKETITFKIGKQVYKIKLSGSARHRFKTIRRKAGKATSK